MYIYYSFHFFMKRKKKLILKGILNKIKITLHEHAHFKVLAYKFLVIYNDNSNSEP